MKEEVKVKTEVTADDIKKVLSEVYKSDWEMFKMKRREVDKQLNRVNAATSSEFVLFVNRVLYGVFGHLSMKNSVVYTLPKTKYYIKSVVANKLGVRSLNDYSRKTRELDVGDLIEVLSNGSLEKWIKNNKPDKYNDYMVFKSAFFNPKFNKRFFNIDNRGGDSVVSLPINKDIVFITQTGYGDNIEAIKSCVLESIFIDWGSSYSINMRIKGDKDVKSFPLDFWDTLGVQSVLPDASHLLDMYLVYIDNSMSEFNGWLNDFKLAMSKYISLLNI